MTCVLSDRITSLLAPVCVAWIACGTYRTSASSIVKSNSDNDTKQPSLSDWHGDNMFWALKQLNTITTSGHIFAAFSIRPFLKNICSLALLETDAQNVSMLTGSGVSSAIILISIGFIVGLLPFSVSLTEPSLYESNTRSILVAFLHIASNMVKKV